MCILHRQDSENPPPTAMLRLDWKAMNSTNIGDEDGASDDYQ